MSFDSLFHTIVIIISLDWKLVLLFKGQAEDWVSFFKAIIFLWFGTEFRVCVWSQSNILLFFEASSRTPLVKWTHFPLQVLFVVCESPQSQGVGCHSSCSFSFFYHCFMQIFNFLAVRCCGTLRCMFNAFTQFLVAWWSTKSWALGDRHDWDRQMWLNFICTQSWVGALNPTLWMHSSALSTSVGG